MVTRPKISDAGEGALGCKFNVEVIEGQNAKRPAVRCIAW